MIKDKLRMLACMLRMLGYVLRMRTTTLRSNAYCEAYLIFQSEKGLEMLTNILCPISVICLVLVIAMFTKFKAIQTKQLIITRHLCCALLPAKLLLLTFVDRYFLRSIRIPKVSPSFPVHPSKHYLLLPAVRAAHAR